MQLQGMSGSPTFNGCGLVGVGVANTIQAFKSNHSDISNSEVVPIQAVLDLVATPEAKAFRIRKNRVMRIDIPRKAYCNNPRYK
jgi:hypothetical protein